MGILSESEKLVKEVVDVYSLPNVYYEIDNAIADPNCTTGRIADILSQDTGLSSRLLRLANSAFFGFPSKIDSISRAVTIIGTQQLRDLVLATSVIKMFQGIESDVVNMETFWRHSIACGVCARAIATQLKEHNVESYFVAGILHDIGALILYIHRAEQEKQALAQARENNTLVHAQELAIMGLTHNAVGGVLLKEWSLPSKLSETVLYHHQPFKTRNNKLMATVIHYADIIVSALNYGSSGESLVPPLDEEAWNNVDISESTVQSILKIVDKQIDDTIKLIFKELAD